MPLLLRRYYLGLRFLFYSIHFQKKLSSLACLLLSSFTVQYSYSFYCTSIYIHATIHSGLPRGGQRGAVSHERQVTLPQFLFFKLINGLQMLVFLFLFFNRNLIIGFPIILTVLVRFVVVGWMMKQMFIIFFAALFISLTEIYF